MTARHRAIALAGSLMLCGSTLFAQGAVVTLDKVPKKQLAETIRQAPRDQVFIVHGKRMTKDDIAREAQAVQARRAAQVPVVRARMAELLRSSNERVAQQRAAQNAALEAANAKVVAAAKALAAK